MTEPPKTCIVLVNFKSWRDTIACLESLLKLDYPDFRIVVVDNSPDEVPLDQMLSWARGELQAEEGTFPELVFPGSAPVPHRVVTEGDLVPAGFAEKILFIRAAENRGFAAANNTALRAVSGDPGFRYFWLLNNDTVVTPATLAALVHTQRTSRMDLVGSVLYEYEKPDRIQSAGGRYLPVPGWIRLNRDPDQPVDYPVGASLFITSEFHHRVGPMCESYFLFFEEYDWVLRARKVGMGFCVENESRIYHKGGGAIGSTSKFSDFYGIRSKILFNRKFFKSTIGLFYILHGGMYILNRLLRGQADRIPMFFKLIGNPKLRYHEVVDQ